MTILREIDSADSRTLRQRDEREEVSSIYERASADSLKIRDTESPDRVTGSRFTASKTRELATQRIPTEQDVGDGNAWAWSEGR